MVKLLNPITVKPDVIFKTKKKHVRQQLAELQKLCKQYNLDTPETEVTYTKLGRTEVPKVYKILLCNNIKYESGDEYNDKTYIPDSIRKQVRDILVSQFRKYNKIEFVLEDLLIDENNLSWLLNYYKFKDNNDKSLRVKDLVKITSNPPEHLEETILKRFVIFESYVSTFLDYNTDELLDSKDVLDFIKEKTNFLKEHNNQIKSTEVSNEDQLRNLTTESKKIVENIYNEFKKNFEKHNFSENLKLVQARISPILYFVPKTKDVSGKEGKGRFYASMLELSLIPRNLIYSSKDCLSEFLLLVTNFPDKQKSSEIYENPHLTFIQRSILTLADMFVYTFPVSIIPSCYFKIDCKLTPEILEVHDVIFNLTYQTRECYRLVSKKSIGTNNKEV